MKEMKAMKEKKKMKAKKDMMMKDERYERRDMCLTYKRQSQEKLKLS